MDEQALVNKCTNFDDAIKTYPFTKPEYKDLIVIRHKSNNKWFGIISYMNGELCLTIKCPPDLIPVLKEQYPAVKPGWHMNKKHWCTIEVNNLPNEALEEIIKIGYHITLPKKLLKK